MKDKREIPKEIEVGLVRRRLERIVTLLPSKGYL